MVRVKYRYLAIQVIPERKMTVTAEMVKKMISKAVIEEFGYKSALSLYSLQIIDTYETLHIFNIKVLREIHLEIKKSLATFYKSSTSIRIDTVAISGSIRGLRKKVIALSKRKKD